MLYARRVFCLQKTHKWDSNYIKRSNKVRCWWTLGKQSSNDNFQIINQAFSNILKSFTKYNVNIIFINIFVLYMRRIYWLFWKDKLFYIFLENNSKHTLMPQIRPVARKTVVKMVWLLGFKAYNGNVEIEQRRQNATDVLCLYQNVYSVIWSFSCVLDASSV